MGSQQTKDEKAIIEPWGAQLPGNAGKRTCLITGEFGSAESARSLLVKGYKVIIACRNAEKAKAAVSKLKSLVQFKTDAEANDAISFQILDVSSVGQYLRR